MLAKRFIGAVAERGVVEVRPRGSDDPEVRRKQSESSPYSDGRSMRRARSPVAPNINRVEAFETMRGLL